MRRRFYRLPVRTTNYRLILRTRWTSDSTGSSLSSPVQDTPVVVKTVKDVFVQFHRSEGDVRLFVVGKGSWDGKYPGVGVENRLVDAIRRGVLVRSDPTGSSGVPQTILGGRYTVLFRLPPKTVGAPTCRLRNFFQTDGPRDPSLPTDLYGPLLSVVPPLLLPDNSLLDNGLLFVEYSDILFRLFLYLFL